MSFVSPTSILATGRIGSHLEGHRGMLKTLAAAQRSQSLVVDAGGMFGPTGYNRLGRGEVERLILAQLYDLVLPAGPGFSHYLNDPALLEKCVCTNLTRPDGSDLVRPSATARVAGMQTVVLGVIGREAFDAIPAADRGQAVWHPPAQVIHRHARRAHGSRRTEVIVLSYCKAQETTDIAWACRGVVSALVSALDHPGPGTTSSLEGVTVVSAGANAAGYSQLRPLGARWEAVTHPFPSDARGRPPARLADLHLRIDVMTDALKAEDRRRSAVRAHP